MTKSLLSFLGVGLLAGSAAANPPGPTAIGERDASGARTGEYRIVGGSGDTWAEGSFAHGKMDGKWRFFDSHHVKVAELTYRQGAAFGPFRTFFGSLATPPAAGKLESEGVLQDGRVVGRHVGYDASGKVFTDAVVEAGKVSGVKVGTSDQAAKTSELDEEMVRTMEKVIRPALR